MSKWKEIEEQYGETMENILPPLFEEHGSQHAVAKTIGISQPTLYMWLLKLGLEQKTILVRRERAS